MKQIKRILLVLVALLGTLSFTASAVINPGDTLTMDGVRFKVPATATNLIANPGFEEGLTSNWTSGTGAAILAANFAVRDSGGFNNSKYLVGTVDQGSNTVGALRTLWPLQAGKGYLLSYYCRYTDTSKVTGLEQYLKISLTQTAGTETQVQIANSSVGGKNVWALNQTAFTGKYSFVQAHFRWLNSKFGFDNFALIQLDSIGLDLTSINNAIAAAQAYLPSDYPGKSALEAAITTAEAAKATVKGPADITTIINNLNAAIRTYRLTQSVTPGDTLDFTFAVVNPGCDAGSDVVPNGWTINKGIGNSYTNNNQHYSGTTNRYLDSWNGTAGALIYVATQTVPGLPKGTYLVSAAARSTGTGVYVTGNDRQTQVPNNGDAGGTLGPNLKGWNLVKVDSVVNLASSVTIGVKTTTGWTGTWFSADDFKLYYLGEKVDDYKKYMNSVATTVRGIDTLLVPGGVKSLMKAALAKSDTANTVTSVLAVSTQLAAARDSATLAMPSFAELKAQIVKASALDTTYAGWAKYKTAIATANTLVGSATAMRPQILTGISTLKTAMLTYQYTKPASDSIPANYTFVIANPSFEDGMTGWTYSSATDVGSKPNSNATYTMAGCDSSYLFNIWGGSNLPYTVKQTITGLPNGFYALSAVVASDTLQTITLFGNGKELNIATTNKNNGILDTLTGIQVFNNTLEIGAKSQTWYKADNFRLTYIPPIDMTSRINNPTINATGNNVAVTGWTITKNTGNNCGDGQDIVANDPSRYLDSWNGTTGYLIYDAKQTIKGIPNGIYTVSAAARTSGTKSYIYANDKQTEITNLGGAGGDLGGGWNTTPVNGVAVLDSTITIGAKTVPGWTGQWFSADNFAMQYLGEGNFALYKPVLDSLIAKAQRFDKNTSPNGVDAALDAAITTAQAANDLNTVLSSYTTLKQCYDANVASVASYAAFKVQITKATTLSTTTAWSGLAALNTALTAANAVYDGAATVTADVPAAITALKAALVAYQITAPAPADFTCIMANPGFEDGTASGVDPASIKKNGTFTTPIGWNLYLNIDTLASNVNAVSISGASMAEGNLGFETWAPSGMIRSINMSQKIVAPEAGYYLLSGMLRCDGSSPNAADPVKYDGRVYAQIGSNPQVASIKLGEAPGLITGSGWNAKTAWRTLSVAFQAAKGDTIKIGAASASFMQMDNFTLSYRGNNNPTTIDIGYITKYKAMNAAADSVMNDPVYRMLKADPKLNVVIKAVTDVTKTSPIDLTPFDVLVIQESMGGGDSILSPRGPLGLSTLPVPTLYNKTYAFKAKRALNAGAAGTGAEATAGVYTLKVDSINRANTLFNAIPMVNGEFKLFKAGAADDGATGTKALNVATGVVGTEGTLLAYPTGVAPAICINDMPAGDTIGGMILKSRTITFGMNFGAMCTKFGDNMTDANYTLWRNAIYKLAGLAVPTTPVLVPRKSASVGYFAFKKAMNAATADTVGNDPIYRMLKADPKLNVTMNTLTDVTDTAKVDMGAYDIVIVQESFGGGDKILTPAGALGLSKFTVPTLYNKAYAFKTGRALADGSAAAGAETAAAYTLTIDSTQLSNPLFKAMPLVGKTARLFMVGAADNGDLTGTKALNYATGVTGTTGTMLAYPTGATTPAIGVNDIPAGAVIGGQTINARMITMGQNYGALCRENGGNITDANYTLWRNAVYSLGRIEIPSTPVTMPKGPKLTAQVGYFTLKKPMDVTADSVEIDPIYRMLKADSKLNVTMNLLTTSTAATQVDMTPYDVIVIQETIGGGDGILTPNGSLALAKLTVPAVFNKTFAFKVGRAITANDTTGTAAGAEAPAGTWTMTVDTANQKNPLFNGITFNNNNIQLFTGDAADNGLVGTTHKALSYTPNVPGVQGTLLAYPTGVANAKIAFNDIPAGTTVGGQLTKSRIITMGMNFGAMCAQHGLFVTNDNHTLWRNAIYSLGRIAIPTTGVVFNAVKPVEVDAASVEVYPNPTSDMLHIRGIEAKSIVKVYSVTGQQVFAGQAEGETTTIDLSRFNKGLYLLKVETNGKTVTTKVVKK